MATKAQLQEELDEAQDLAQVLADDAIRARNLVREQEEEISQLRKQLKHAKRKITALRNGFEASAGALTNAGSAMVEIVAAISLTSEV